MLTLYDYLSSGNGYKVRLLLHQLAIPYRRVELDIMRGETRTADYLAKNSNGRIPALELEDGSVLPESNAILFYLADGTRYLPDDKFARARVISWLFFEQYSHEPFIATSRFLRTHFDGTPEIEKKLEARIEPGYAALTVMERHLDGHEWFAPDYSIADIALYAYTHVADEGGFDLSAYPAIEAWLRRVASEANHIPITHG